jgi:hypothetical protein
MKMSDNDESVDRRQCRRQRVAMAVVVVMNMSDDDDGGKQLSIARAVSDTASFVQSRTYIRNSQRSVRSCMRYINAYINACGVWTPQCSRT